MEEKVIADKSDLTIIADEIRTMTNITNTMRLSTMATHLEETNMEISEQTTLLADALAALDGKSAGGGGSGSSIETCTVNVYWATNSFGGGWVPEGSFTTISETGTLEAILLSDISGVTESGDVSVGDFNVVKNVKNVLVGSTITLADLNGTLETPTIATMEGIEKISSELDVLSIGAVFKITGNGSIRFNC